jgi:DNA-binding transcriptional LysR family regulator
VRIRRIEFLADPTVGELRIGCVDSITVMTLPTVIQNFSRQYPRVALRVDDVPSLSAQLLGLRGRYTISHWREWIEH